MTFQEQETPSPIRESFVQETHTSDNFHVSPARPNEASKSPGIPADEAEDHVTLTNLHALLSRYVKQVGDLEKELKDTKATLGEKIDVLTKRVQTLEAQLEQKCKRKIVINSKDEQVDLNMGSLHLLADATLAQQPSSPAPTATDTFKPKKPILFQRRKHKHRLTKSSEVQALDVEGGSSSVSAASSIPAKGVRISDVPSASADVGGSLDVDSAAGVTPDVVQSEEPSTVFVAGREYVISPGDATTVQKTTGATNLEFSLWKTRRGG